MQMIDERTEQRIIDNLFLRTQGMGHAAVPKG
jgi:hypothetical protein